MDRRTVVFIVDVLTLLFLLSSFPPPYDLEAILPATSPAMSQTEKIMVAFIQVIVSLLEKLLATVIVMLWVWFMQEMDMA